MTTPPPSCQHQELERELNKTFQYHLQKAMSIMHFLKYEVTDVDVWHPDTFKIQRTRLLFHVTRMKDVAPGFAGLRVLEPYM